MASPKPPVLELKVLDPNEADPPDEDGDEVMYPLINLELIIITQAWRLFGISGSMRCSQRCTVGAVAAQQWLAMQLKV